MDSFQTHEAGKSRVLCSSSPHRVPRFTRFEFSAVGKLGRFTRFEFSAVGKLGRLTRFTWDSSSPLSENSVDLQGSSSPLSENSVDWQGLLGTRVLRCRRTRLIYKVRVLRSSSPFGCLIELDFSTVCLFVCLSVQELSSFRRKEMGKKGELGKLRNFPDCVDIYF